MILNLLTFALNPCDKVNAPGKEFWFIPGAFSYIICQDFNLLRLDIRDLAYQTQQQLSRLIRTKNCFNFSFLV